MTPLTHAIVGTAIYHYLRRPWAGRWGWVLAFPLAFASHYLLDAIPHFEGGGPLLRIRYSPWVFPALAGIGSVLSWYLYRRNRQAALLWLALCGWVGMAGISIPLVRVAATLALLGYIAYRTRQAHAVGYGLAGVLAIAADMIPQTWSAAVAFHDRMHSRVDWGTYLYREFQSSPVPANWLSRLQDPYFLVGYGLEVLVEGLIFLAAFSVFSGLRLEPGTSAEPSEAAVAASDEAREPAYEKSE